MNEEDNDCYLNLLLDLNINEETKRIFDDLKIQLELMKLL